jgi:two-component sensor histidine kinase
MVLKFVNSRLSLAPRLALLAAILAIPLLLLCALFVRQGWKDIAFVDSELQGAAYLSTLWPLVDRAATGAPADEASRRRFDQARARLDPSLGTKRLADAFAAPPSAIERTDRGAALIETVADRSKLTLDPHLDSFYLVAATTEHLPDLADAAADLSRANAMTGPPLARAARMGSAFDRVRARGTAAVSALHKAMAGNTSGITRRALAAQTARLEAEVDALSRKGRAAAAGRQAGVLDLQGRQHDLESQVDITWRAANTELTRLLQARRLRLLTAFWGGLALVALALAGSTAVAWATLHNLAVRVSGLLRTMDRLIAGDLAVTVPYRDEPGEVGQIAGGVEALKQATAERTRLLAELETANRELEEHRSWLQLALEVGRMGAWRRRLPGGQLELSPELAQLAGFPPDVPLQFPDDIAPLMVEPEQLRRFVDEQTRLEQGELDPGLTEVMMPIRRRDTGEIRWLMLRREMVADSASAARQIVGVAIDITERKHMMDELNHRVKNNLATVLSLAMQTAKSSEDVRTFQKVFTGRLQALARINELLARRAWAYVPVREVLNTALRSWLESGAVEVGGSPEELSVSARAAVSLSLVLHEMAAAAARTGALAAEDGKLEVVWSEVDPDHGELEWTERAAHTTTSRETLDGGSRLIERLAEGDLGGRAEFDFRPEGLKATICFALAGATA